MADSALIFEAKPPSAGTHVLLIGVGDYPWLEGGAKAKSDAHHENAMGMGQLSSPLVSIRRLADWFLDGFANADRPLASLALLLSESNPATYDHPALSGGPKAVPRGTISDVEKAVSAWVRRATRQDDMLVFGFCGHGVQSSNPVLLCRDYGKNVENRFQGAIDFEEFRIALSTRRPDNQLLLVDACRTPDMDKSLLGVAAPGNSLLHPASLATRDNAPALQSVHFATSLYTEAWGRSDAPSLFSQALLDSLAGGGADRTDQWWVTTTQMQGALATYVARASREEGVVQRPAAGQLHHFKINKPPKITVPVYVRSLEPGIWREPLRLEARRGGLCAEGLDYVPANDGGTGQAVLECSMRLVNPSQKVADVVYDVHALFQPTSGYGDCSEQIIAYPPEVTCELPVGKRP